MVFSGAGRKCGLQCFSDFPSRLTALAASPQVEVVMVTSALSRSCHYVQRADLVEALTTAIGGCVTRCPLGLIPDSTGAGHHWCLYNELNSRIHWKSTGISLELKGFIFWFGRTWLLRHSYTFFEINPGRIQLSWWFFAHVCSPFDSLGHKKKGWTVKPLFGSGCWFVVFVTNSGMTIGVEQATEAN